jgi:hypothetical protein
MEGVTVTVTVTDNLFKHELQKSRALPPSCPVYYAARSVPAGLRARVTSQRRYTFTYYLQVAMGRNQCYHGHGHGHG